MVESVMRNATFRKWHTLFHAHFEEMRKSDEFREGLAAMAEIIQEGLTHHQLKDRIPYSGGIELVMRAVTHAIGDPDGSAGYILMKLDGGHRCLESWMSKGKNLRQIGFEEADHGHG